jgi:hypothetical protein
MSSLREIAAVHRRIGILRILASPDVAGSANESVLKDALEDLGLEAGLTREAVREDLRFLEKCGAVRLEWFDDKLMKAHITERGVDIAKGRVIVEGIKRPSLGT